MNWRIIAANLLIIIAWGSAFPGIKIALQSYSPGHLALFRFLIGSTGLILFAIIKKIKIPAPQDWPAIFTLGFLGFTTYHVSLSIGEESVSAGISSFIISAAPIFSAVLAAIFLKERFQKTGWIGSIIAFSGVALISFGTGNSMTGHLIGVVFILVAALGESFYFVFQSRLLTKYGHIQFTTYTIIAGTFFMLMYLPGLGREIEGASISATVAVIYLGIVPTVLPYFSIAYLTSKLGAATATSSLYLTPVAALLISWIFINEIPVILSLVGGILTLLGVSLANLKMKKKD